MGSAKGSDYRALKGILKAAGPKALELQLELAQILAISTDPTQARALKEQHF